MKLLYLLAVAGRALSRRKLRSLLMMLGIILGIASLTVLNSIGEGTQQETMKRVRNMLGTFDTVLIRPGAGKMRGMVSVTNAPPNLKFEDAAALASELPEINQVALLQNAFGVEAKAGGRVVTPAVFGVSENWLALRGEDIAQGVFLSQSDVHSSNRVAVLGSEAASELFPSGNCLNQKLLIGNVPFQVIGVLQSRGAGPAGGSLDDLILIPVTTASKRLFNRDFLTMVIAQIKNPERSAAAIQSITTLLRRRHHLAPSAIDDFTITDPKAVMRQLLDIGSVFNKTLIGLSVAATALGGLVIMILMLMGVSERRREIGIRRAVGASRSDIVVEFLLEAVLLSATGGLLAMALASAGVALVARAQKLPLAFSPECFTSNSVTRHCCRACVRRVSSLACRTTRPCRGVEILIPMRWRYICRESIRVLVRFRVRSSMMLCSALAGVAGLLVSTNYAAAGRAKVISQLEGMGTNLILVTPQQSRNVGGRARTGSIVTTLREADYRAIRKEVSHLEKSSAIATASYLVKAGDLSKPACTIVGCEAAYAELKHWTVQTGRFLQPLDDRRLARVAVLGATVANDLFPGSSPVDQMILINRVPFQVVGVLSERGQGLDSANEDNQVYVPDATLLTRLRNREYLDSLVLQIDSISEMATAILSVNSILKRRHRIRVDGRADYVIQNQQQTIETLDQSSRRLSFLIHSVGLSALLVSGLGLLGISWISLKDRTRELGTSRSSSRVRPRLG